MYKLLFLATLFIAVRAQAPAAAPMMESGGTMPSGPAFAPGPALPAMDCSSALVNMSSCLTFVEQGSKSATPDKGCCPSLASLVDNQPLCLCDLLSKGDAFGIQIDTVKALKLPTACKVVTPDVSLCSAVGMPVASPGPMASDATMGPGMVPAMSPTNMASAGTSIGSDIPVMMVAAAAMLVFGM